MADADAAMMSKTSMILVASLVTNAVLIGIVGGRLFSPPQPSEPTVQMQLERYGPASDVVNAAWKQLPEDDRTALRQELRERWAAMSDERKRLSDAGKRVYDAAFEEPFDETKLRDAVALFQLRENRLQQTAEDILISHLGKMPREARATAAVGLLTPFNARMQRADNQEKSAGPGSEAAPSSAPQPPGAAPPRSN
jgi:uncharacterized membrane protein